jgi:hypothetical protein
MLRSNAKKECFTQNINFLQTFTSNLIWPTPKGVSSHVMALFTFQITLVSTLTARTDFQMTESSWQWILQVIYLT